MNEQDRPAFAGLLGDVHGFYQQPVTQFALSVWWEACKAFDLSQVRRAMTAHATDPERGQFCPKPADVIRQLQADTRERSALSWGHVLAEVRRVGTHGSPRLDATQQAAVDAIGGWYALCRGDESALPHLQRRFIEAAQVLDARERRQELLLGSPGGKCRGDARDVVRALGNGMRVTQ